MAFDYAVSANAVDYIPKWMDQRAKYKTGEDLNPVIIRIKLITMADSEEWSKRMFALQQPSGVDADGSEQQEQTLEMGKQQIISAIESIQNLSFNGNPIVSGLELWGTPYKDLVLEVAEAVRDFNILTKGDVKNLKRPSDGSSEDSTVPATSA